MLVTYSREVRSLNQSQYAVVGIGTRVQTGGFEGARDFFSLPKNIQTMSGCSPSLLCNGYCGSFPSGKVAEADNTCTPLYSFMV